ncbi:MAG: hypothetical protein QF827_08220 [Alphaproteobacteria bacterium]|jgi:hypothetical protein|nr:hypothetical protein [Alphaproteobacteria bacterium]|tara:strand:+ start:735 stop:1097 length:363 start_codon:yes stop_codon:yes gene_type:complete
MPITEKYLFIVSMDVEPGFEDLFNEVYDQEHVPSLSKVPGVISATRAMVEPFPTSGETDRRYTLAKGEPTFTAIYELESPSVLVSKEWAELAETGRWPTEVRPHTRNRRHVLRRVMTPDG